MLLSYVLKSLESDWLEISTWGKMVLLLGYQTVGKYRLLVILAEQSDHVVYKDISIS